MGATTLSNRILEAFLNGESGIIQVPTGCGKTYAALMGPLSQIEDPKNNKSVKYY